MLSFTQNPFERLMSLVVFDRIRRHPWVFHDVRFGRGMRLLGTSSGSRSCP